MRRPLTLGSLFDGIGGFPLAGKLAGMRPVWASEIEPFPIRVTEKRLPGMKHYGNIFSLRGAGLEPVDVVTFGSPCQDLSIAGKREGLGGGRSSLFFEAVRIIREMREATDENTQGGLSGKTCQARCPLTMGRIFGKSSKALSASKTRGRCSSACGRALAARRRDHGRRSFPCLARPRRRAGLGRRTKTETCICCPRS